MADKVAITSNNFPFKRLAEVLNRTQKVCIIGYEFSWASRHAPHFKDIRQGIWSNLTEKSKINPFASEHAYCVVMNWFNCRRQVISASNQVYEDSDKPSAKLSEYFQLLRDNKPKEYLAIKQSDFFQMMRKMRNDLGLTIATQCEDGLMGLNDIENAYELYGNIFQAKCHENGHEFSSWPTHNEIRQRIVCESCGSAIFPNVEMFGWNNKIDVRKKLLDQIEKSEALILMGVDRNLSPFNEVKSEHYLRLPVIELLNNGIIFEENNSTNKLSFNDIEKYIEERISTTEWSSKGTEGYQKAMGYLMQIHKISEN